MVNETSSSQISKTPSGGEGLGAFKYVSSLILSGLGFMPYGMAVPSKMRLLESAGAETPAIEFWFPVNDPEPGATAGLKRRYPTAAGTVYRLSVEILDGYKS